MINLLIAFVFFPKNLLTTATSKKPNDFDFELHYTIILPCFEIKAWRYFAVSLLFLEALLFMGDMLFPYVRSGIVRLVLLGYCTGDMALNT